jgi:hypothetical protein
MILWWGTLCHVHRTPEESPCFNKALLAFGGFLTFVWMVYGYHLKWDGFTSYAAGNDVPEDMTREAWQVVITAEGSLFQVNSGHFLAVFYGVWLAASLLAIVLFCLIFIAP